MSSTREMVLDMLKNAQGKFVSSKEICASLHTSRTAVWKHIHALQSQGYRVEAVTNKGYRLDDSVDFVTAHELKACITSSVLGRHVAYREIVDSTNSVARILAEEGALDGTLVIADEQTQGRGRFNRKWISPPKSGILMSLIIRPSLSIAEASKLTSLAAVAVAKSLAALSNAQVQIKWPNDVLFNGKKISGILTEVSAEGNLIQYIIVGVGINANTLPAMFPDSLQSNVCSLHEIVGKPIKRAQVVADVLLAFETLYDSYCKGGDFSAVLNYIRDHSVTIGKFVEVDVGSMKIAGIAEDIADDGALVVRLADRQIKKLYSGDILCAHVIS